MQKKAYAVFFNAVFFFLLLASPVGATTSTLPFQNLESADEWLMSHEHGLSPRVFKLALQAYQKAKEMGVARQPVLTVVDYTKPSTEPRLWVIDLEANKVSLRALVAHGKNSGDIIPRRFSDKPGSQTSSLGVYVTGQTYIGNHGLSLRLNGLERGFNESAASRAVVIHPADYATQNFIKTYGRLGRSQGCLAVDPAIANPLIEKIRDGSVVFVYYPDHRWLKSSAFLKS